jgi:hypothetical protein
MIPATTQAYHDATWGTDPEIPDVIRPLSWLRSLIDEAERMHGLLEKAEEALGNEFKDEDPSAFWEMIQECKALHAGLTDAAAKTNEALS